MKTYSEDLRQRVLKDCDAGMPTQAVAQKYAVSKAWVRRLKQRRRETGEIGPKKQRHGPIPTWVTHADKIREAVRQAPDATLAEYSEHYGLSLPRATLARALLMLGLTRKKKRCMPANKIAQT
jgi:transposase